MMKLKIADNCNFDLDRRPIYTFHDNSYEQVPDKIALYHGDNGKYISTVSEKSSNNLRSYGEFVGMLNEGIVDSDMNTDDIKISDNIYNDGKRFARIMDFPAYKFDYRGEMFNLRLWSWTAYDLNWAEQFIFGPINIICMNGQFTSNWKIQGMSKKNWNRKASITSLDIKKGIDEFLNFPERLEVLSNSMVNNWQVKHLFENTIAHIKDDIHPRVSDYRMRQLSTLWDRYKGKFGMNLYSVYQTATDWASNPEGKGMPMNMTRTRSQQIVDMMKSNDWIELCQKEIHKARGFAPREVAAMAG